MFNETRPLTICADSIPIATDNRIRIQGKSCMTLIPDIHYVDIYNLSDTDMERIRKSNNITVSGRDDSVLVYGELEDFMVAPDGNNEITTLVLVDGKTLRDTVLNKSIRGGATVRSTLSTLLGPAVFGSYLASDVRLPRGQVYSGKLLQAVRELAKTAGARGFLSNGTVHVVNRKVSESEITITDEEIEDTPDQNDGMYVLRTVVKGFPVGTIVKWNQRKLRLVSQAVDADNLKGAWRSEVMLLDEEYLDRSGWEGG